MNKRAILVLVFFVTVLGTSFCFAAMDAAIVYEVMQGAEITKVSYFLKDVGGSPKLHFEIAVKNTSSEPKRFEVKVFLLDGPSCGGNFPRKGKPAVVQPGEEHSRTFPVFYSELPKGYRIMVTETKYIP